MRRKWDPRLGPSRNCVLSFYNFGNTIPRLFRLHIRGWTNCLWTLCCFSCSNCRIATRGPVGYRRHITPVSQIHLIQMFWTTHFVALVIMSFHCTIRDTVSWPRTQCRLLHWTRVYFGHVRRHLRDGVIIGRVIQQVILLGEATWPSNMMLSHRRPE